jgi:hypothetical protein
MSSTDDRGEQRLRRFHSEQLVPAAERLEARGVEMFPLRADPAQTTYYVTRPPAEYVFELNAEDVEGYLHARWTAEGHTELAALAPALGALSRELEQKVEEGSSDVSSFVYAMF